MGISKRVSIIGNGPVEAGSGAAIDAADMVIRFNEPWQPPEDIGSRTDILFLVNSGKSMQARLANAQYLESNPFRAAKEIILPYHPSVIARYHRRPNLLSRLKGRRADWTWQTIEALGERGKPVTVLPVSFYEQGCEELGIAPAQMQKLFPSTGFLGIRYALARFPAPEWSIEIRGFSWKGWKRHDWELERNWATRKSHEGVLVLA